MSRAKWNLKILDNQSIKIYQIYADIDSSEASLEDIALRMDILAHQLSYQSAPAFFHDTPLKYFPEIEKRPVCVVFDAYDKFKKLEIPFWSKYSMIEWDLNTMYEKQLVNIFQKALTSYYLYQFQDLSPHYFTSFLFIEEDPVLFEPFYFKPVPVLHNGQIGVRFLTNIDDSSIANAIELAQVGSSILISPNELPFNIVTLSADSFTIQNSDGNFITYEIASTDFIILTKFSKNFLESKHATKRTNSTYHYSAEFAPIQTFSFTPTNFKDFYQANFVVNDDDNANSWTAQNQTYLEDGPYTVDMILNDQCQSPEIRKAIRKYSGKQYYPIKFDPLMRHTITISAVDLNFGFPSPKIRIQLPSINLDNEFTYESFNIPYLKLVEDDTVRPIQADYVFDNWIEYRRAPLSGAKDLHYIIFCEDDQYKLQILDYIHLISSSYIKYRLGKLTPASKPEDLITPSGNETLEIAIAKFLQGNTIQDFVHNKYVIFIVSDSNFENNIRGYSVFLRPNWIFSPNSNDIDAMCFQIYSKVRELRTEPYGSFEITAKLDKNSSPANNLFFNMRYQPPYILSTMEPFVLHVGLDLRNHVVVYSDHECQMLKIETIENFDSIKNYVSGIPSILNVPSIETVITVFTESLSAPIIERIRGEMVGINCSILSFFPMTDVQVSEDMKNDGILEISENIFNSSALKPDFSVLIVSSSLESYKLSIYGGTLDKLKSIARNFIDLSWVSIKPGMPKRTTSFPPHMVGLMKGCYPDLADLSPLSFLPPKCLDF